MSSKDDVLIVKKILDSIGNDSLNSVKTYKIINSVSNLLSYDSAFLLLKEYFKNKTDKFISNGIKDSYSDESSYEYLLSLAKLNPSFNMHEVELNDPLYYVERSFKLKDTIESLNPNSDAISKLLKFYEDKEDLLKLTENNIDELKDIIQYTLNEIEKNILSMKNADNNNFYLQSKKCKSVYGLKEDSSGSLIIPLKSIINESFTGYEKISKDGKKNAAGTELKGSYFSLGNNDSKLKVVCEGIATAISLKTAFDDLNIEVEICAAITAYNVYDICKNLLLKNKNCIVEVFADKDSFNQMTSGDTGLKVAVKCAKELGISWVSPLFKNQKLSHSKKSNRLKGYTDFNDLYISEGIEAVKNQVLSHINVNELHNLNKLDYVHFNQLKSNKRYIDDLLKGERFKSIKEEFGSKESYEVLYHEFKSELDERSITKDFFLYHVGINKLDKNSESHNDVMITVDMSYKQAISNINKYGCIKKVKDDISKWGVHVDTYRDILKIVYKIYCKNLFSRSCTHTPLTLNASLESKYSSIITYKNYDSISKISINNGIHFIEASMGSGKTEHSIVNTLEEYSKKSFYSLIIVSTKSLKDSYLSRFYGIDAIDIDDVRDLNFEEMEEHLKICRSKVLVCTVGSLTLAPVKSFVNASSGKLLTIADEIATTSSVLVNEDITRNRNGGAFSIFSYFIHLIKKKSKCALLLDASINNDVISLINSIGKKCTIHNVVKTTNDRSISITDEVCLRNDIHELMSKNKKCIIACDSATAVEEYYEHFSELYNVLAITNDRRNNKEVDLFIKDATNESKKYDIVIYSPLIGPGNHIESFGENYHFDKVYGVFNSAGPSPSYCAQMLCRVRSNCDILISYNGNYKNVILSNYSDESSRTFTQIKLSSEFRGLENRLYKSFELHKANVDKNVKNAKSIFIIELMEYMKYNGFKFIGYVSGNTDNKKLKSISTILKETYNSIETPTYDDCKLLIEKFNEGLATKYDKDAIRSYLLKSLYKEDKISDKSIEHFSNNARLLRYMRLNKKYDSCTFYDISHKDDVLFYRKMFSEIFGECFNGGLFKEVDLSRIKNKLTNPKKTYLVEFLHKQNIITYHTSRNIKNGNMSKHALLSIIKAFGFDVINNSRKNEINILIDEQLELNATVLTKLKLKKLL